MPFKMIPRLRRIKTVALGSFLGAIGILVTSGQPIPKVHDERLELKLFASDPDIVTPIGMALDGRDRLFAIESHTHNPPRDYPGPKSDRIKIFEDRDHDGKADRITTFADGFKDAMNLAFAPNGDLYLVCAREVWALRDRDGDGRCDSRSRLLELKTANTHSHSALLGITFGPDGWLYISRGNNGSAAYTLVGTDGSTVSGYGDGGNIMRCLPDGTKVEEVATGFWNPFDIKFDSFGRLLCVDNDPDARGPNRLLQIVPRGDYGYKSIYGGSGNHPFQSWEGELPGTLPMIDGTGEAPSGLLDCSLAALPLDYRGNLLVTIWNENTITRHVMQPRGVSLTATNSILISGGQDFRPVALDADRQGNIYITDWVLVNYPNHGRGRIWKLSTKTNSALSQPRLRFGPPQANEAFKPFHEVFESRSAARFPKLANALQSEDPFLRHAAVEALARPALREQALAAATHAISKVRLGALLALRRGQIENPDALLKQFLRDPNVDARRMALVWIGESGLTNLRPNLEVALQGGEVSGALFETYLAAVEGLDPNFITAYRSRSRDRANQLTRRQEPGLIESILRDETRSPQVRALAVVRLEGSALSEHHQLLAQLARHDNSTLKLEAIRSLGRSERSQAIEELNALVFQTAAPSFVRAEALSALSWQPIRDFTPWLPLLENEDATIAEEAVRLLRRGTGQETVLKALEAKRTHLKRHGGGPALAEQLEFALFPHGSEPTDGVPRRPSTLEEWQAALATGGDPRAGERWFFSARSSCLQCHTIRNRGGKLGPDLSHLSQSVSRSQIVHSILRPSDAFPPQYQVWFIKTKDGEEYEGLQLDHTAGGLELWLTSGKFEQFRSDQVESYGARARSLMPDGLENTLTTGEMRDLVSFLESLR